MPVYDKSGEPFPSDHPLAKGAIGVGRKPRPASAPSVSPTDERPSAEACGNGDGNLQLGLWHMTVEPESLPVIRDQEGNLIATIHAQSLEAQLGRASLIMSAPALLDAVIAALDVFRVMAEHACGQASLAAQDMIPALESALAAANMLRTIDEADLIGA